MAEKTYLAFVGNRAADGTLTIGPLRLFCCKKCEGEANFPNTQMLTELPVDDGVVERSEVCFKCGKSLWREPEAK